MSRPLLPPSTSTSVPVMNDASGPSRKPAAEAMSSGVPRRLAGEAVTMVRIPSPYGEASSAGPIGVEMMPGLMEFMRASFSPLPAGGLDAKKVGLLGNDVGPAWIVDGVDERQRQQLFWRGAGESLRLLGGQRWGHVPGHTRDHHAGTASADHFAERVDYQRNSERSTAKTFRYSLATG